MYENKILQTDEPTASEQQLNDFGNEGWELIAIVPWEGKWYYYFKRPKMAA